jgi:pimeloyl-ACP methyl ester carboxylesterase
VGGYQLHIQCTGTGSPTVVLDAGLTGMSLDWYLVQAEIAKTSRVCSYDRAGMGWSDPGPQPRTPSRIAGELHTLLTNAGIPGPYVLVGHSLAGKNVRMFAIQHPDKVAGMVLVDARGESMDANISPADRAAFEQEIADSATQYGVLRRLGLVRLIGADQWGAPAMPREIRTEGALFRTGQRGLETSAAEALERATDDAQLRGASSLGDRPLIVLASEVNMETLPGWPEAQRQQAELSTKGRLAVVAGSGHYIQWDNPAVVIDAVRQVVTEARGQ